MLYEVGKHPRSTFQKCLDFTGFYRHFIHDYSKIVRPLTDLFKDPDKGKNNRKASSDGIRNRKLHLTWSSEHQQAFEGIIELLTTAPILSFVDHKLPFLLHTSSEGLGLYYIRCRTTSSESSPMPLED